MISLGVNGAIKNHSPEGAFFNQFSVSPFDLIEVREPRVIWANEYLKAFGSVWETEEAAKREAGSGVIATRKFVEVIESSQDVSIS